MDTYIYEAINNKKLKNVFCATRVSFRILKKRHECCGRIYKSLMQRVTLLNQFTSFKTFCFIVVMYDDYFLSTTGADNASLSVCMCVARQMH